MVPKQPNKTRENISHFFVQGLKPGAFRNFQSWVFYLLTWAITPFLIDTFLSKYNVKISICCKFILSICQMTRLIVGFKSISMLCNNLRVWVLNCQRQAGGLKLISRGKKFEKMIEPQSCGLLMVRNLPNVRGFLKC